MFASIRSYLRGSATPQGPLVTIAQGLLRGKTGINYDGEQYYQFLGIPYAKAPVGDLRFCPPQPPEPWTGEYDATVEGPECPSTHMIYLHYVGREDNCLNLNVFTKNLPSENPTLKPVIMFIHGGAFILGSNKCQMYNANYLLTKDVVLVVINYRLGPLGFLSLEDPSLGVPGNAGLKDQVMALRWIKDNIIHFNGDPNNVTVCGESAGAASAHYLMLSPLAKGLFHKAIIQSGSALCPWAVAPRGPKEICRKLRYTETDEKKILEYLRSVSVITLINARIRTRDGMSAGDIRYYAPVVEPPSPDAFISDSPENILRSGNYNKVPMIIGFNNHEGLLFEIIKKVLYYTKFPIENFIGEIDHRLKIPNDKEKQEEIGERVKKFYYDGFPDDSTERTSMLKTDSNFMYPAYRSTKLHRKHTDQPIYFYEMTMQTDRNFCKKLYTVYWFKLYFVLLLAVSKLSLSASMKTKILNLMKPFTSSELKGASHGDDLGYLFDVAFVHSIEKGSPEEDGMRRFVKLWTNFARYGNPTPEASDDVLKVQWKPVDESWSYLELGNELTVRNNFCKDRTKFWDDLFEELGCPYE